MGPNFAVKTGDIIPTISNVNSAETATAVPRKTKFVDRVRTLFQSTLSSLPWEVRVEDWGGNRYRAGGTEAHWAGMPLEIRIRTEAAAKVLLAYDGMRFLEQYLEGEVDLEGNLYMLPDIQQHARFEMKFLQKMPEILFRRAFQSISRARGSVKSHYDIPQEALNVYLDKTYMSYSCGMFEDPENLDRKEMLRIGRGREDDFDSLEKSQWRKFKDAVDFIRPKEGEDLLDVGCGYGGQLAVGLENHPFGKVVGWTHSSNQVREGRKMLSKFEESRWELHEGDYRKESRVFDHVTSTGMVSHVGPRGLVPYVRNVRKRIKTGGRYLHHALMDPYNRAGFESSVGLMFNRKYVWPGFFWFTVGTHVKALEENGFVVRRMTNLSPHYAKTTASWYERLMARRDVMVKNLGEPTVRAWQVFLAGITGAYLNNEVHVYRIYCEARRVP